MVLQFHTVKIYLLNATENANSIIVYILAHFREQFNVNIPDVDVNFCKQLVRHVILSLKK